MGQEKVGEIQELHLEKEMIIYIIVGSILFHEQEVWFGLTTCSKINVMAEGTRELTKPWLMKYSAK